MKKIIAIFIFLLVSYFSFASLTIYNGNQSFSNLTLNANDTIVIRKTETENGNLNISGNLILNNNSYLVVNGNFNLTGNITFKYGEISVRGDMSQSSSAKIEVNSGNTGTLTVMGTFYDDANNNKHPWSVTEHWFLFCWYTFDVNSNFVFNVKSYQNTAYNTSGWALNDKKSALRDLLDDLEENGNNYDEEVLSEKITEIRALLPIKLISFSFEDDTFIWQTASETNNDYFVVEYSRNGKDWVECTEHISSASDYGYTYTTESTINTSYSVFSYFRLKQVDLNGDYSYSDVIVSENKVCDPCSEKYESNKLKVKELGNRWFRNINGELIYCEGDNR